jgi:microcystin-dependent protein
MALTSFKTKTSIEVIGDDGTSYYATVPVGTILMYVGSTAPDGFLVCDGSEAPRTTYPDLNSFYFTGSYPFGNGDGVTTFNLPNFSSRFPIGAGTGVGLTDRPFKEFGGSETHVLTTSQIAPHSHTLGSHTHTGGTTGTENANHGHSRSGTTDSTGSFHEHNATGHTGHRLGVSGTGAVGTNRNTNNNGFNGSTSSASIDSGAGTTDQAGAAHTHNVNAANTSSSDSHAHSFTTGGPSNATVNENTTSAIAVPHVNEFVCFTFIVKY